MLLAIAAAIALTDAELWREAVAAARSIGRMSRCCSPALYVSAAVLIVQPR